MVISTYGTKTMSDWPEALRKHAEAVANRYDNRGMSYDLNNAATHVEQLQAEVERLEEILREVASKVITFE